MKIGTLLPGMRRICTLKADLSSLKGSLKVQKGPKGQDFWRVEHSVAILFGGTQLRARLQWYEGVGLHLVFPQYLTKPCRMFYKRVLSAYCPIPFSRSNFSGRDESPPNLMLRYSWLRYIFLLHTPPSFPSICDVSSISFQ